MIDLTPLKKKQFEYQKSGDVDRLNTLRYLLAQIQYKEIELRAQGQELDKEVVQKVIQKQIKKLKESLEIYRNASRAELATKAERETEIMEELQVYVENL